MLGPGAISRDFVAGLRASQFGVLRAVGSSSPDRAAVFAAEHGAAASGSYDDVLTREDVDAVYIGTVHTTHADLAIRALEAGKAVLCEKPASPTTHEVEQVLQTAQRVRRPFLEAFKTRFGPFADALRGFAAGGELGTPVHVDAAFGFAAGSRKGRLFDPALAGGAILDVGCYPVALAVQIAAAGHQPLDTPTIANVVADQVDGVDATASARISLGGLSAGLSASIVRTLPRSGAIRFARGELVLPEAWGSRSRSPSSIIVRGRDRERRVELPVVQPMAAEADAMSLALADGRLEVPEMPWSHTRAVARVLTQWRADAIGA